MAGGAPMMAPSPPATTAPWDRSHEEEATMYRTDRDLQRAFAARQSEVVKVVADYRYLAAPVLAAREHLSAELARQAALRDGGLGNASHPGEARRWLGGRVVQLGAWLAGTANPPSPQPLTPRLAGVK